MKRRQFISMLGGAAAAWPIATRAQQPAMPVIGILSATGPRSEAMAPFHSGLKDQGFIEQQNVMIEDRWADGKYDRLPALATELAQRKVTVILATGGNASAPAAKAATTTIPIVFTLGSDPVRQAIVSSFNHPGGNITGVTFFARTLAPKQLEILGELVPNLRTVAILLNPNNPNSAPDIDDIGDAARALGLQLHFLRASTVPEIDGAFSSLVPLRMGALFVNADGFFVSRRSQITELAARYGIPAIYARTEYVAAGGLISYATQLADTFRQAGIYVGRILHGEKPGDLPVQQPTKFELVINLKAAKVLGLAVPPTLLARADEVIE